MQEYAQKLKINKPGTSLQHWRNILSLKANYRPDDIVVAVKRALRYRVFEAPTIENFLKVNAQKKIRDHFFIKKPIQ